MDPSRHHDFLTNSDERSNRSTYYGREIPEITSHHYYGPATTTTRTVSSNSTRKPCGCTTTGSGATAGSITCNGCRLNPADEGGGGGGVTGGGWSATMATNNQTEHIQRGAAIGAGPGGGIGLTGDYHHRMAAETSMRSNIRQSPLYAPHHQQQSQQHQSASIHATGGMLPSQQHPGHVGNMPGVRTSYWGHSNTTNSSSTTQPYGSASEEHLDISVSRRNAPIPAPPPPHHDYGPPYKSMSMPTNATHSSQHSSSYQLPSSSLHSTNPLHQRVSAIAGGVGGGIGSAAAVGSNQANTPYKEQRIYDYQKYSTPSTASVATAKMPYNPTPTSANIYDGHHLSSQAMGKSLPIDHHVINPSNLPTSKEQHPSPNYARKCPQMYAPEEQTTAHQHLYMSTPQFSSDKFTRASPLQAPPPPPAPAATSDYSKLRESPSGSSYLHSSDKYLQHTTHLRESPQFPTHSATTTTRNPTAYYGVTQTQNPSKILPPEMSSSTSAIIMKQQSHHANTTPTHHYQYSKSPLPPPLPPSHLQAQNITTLPSNTSQQMAAQKHIPGTPGSLHSQRYLMDSVKREDVEIYEATNQTSVRHGSSSAGAGIYINPYNTPPPTVADNCCKEVALSNSSSPYTTGSATPNYRVESPQFYPTKYAKLSMNENLSISKNSTLLNQNTPPPSRAPSQRGVQHQANYYYEGNSHSAPSPAAATAASPSPSALLTTNSQTPMHHTDYMSSTMPSGPPAPPNSSQLVGANMPSSYASQPSLAAQHHHLTQQQQHHHQHPPSSDSLRNNDLMITVQPSSTHPYERAILHPNQPTSAAPPSLAPQHINSKHGLNHPAVNSPSAAALQMPPVGSAGTAKPVAKHQKPNYRELINQKLALRNATSEEELNMQIIKKTLNVDTQTIRAAPANPLTASNRGLSNMPMAPSARDSSLKSSKPLSSVMVTHSSMSSTARVIELPEALPARICIKQEDEKPSSSSSGGGGGGSTTASSPLDLSMRTVKTKADSTDYKYQQRPTARLTQNASSTTSSSTEGRYTLPRVDSTPIFSVHAFEPGAANAAAVTNRQSNSRHNSLERRNYTPPSVQIQQVAPAPSLAAGSSYPPSSTQHIPAAAATSSSSTHHPYSNREGGTRRLDLPHNLPAQSSQPLSCYENSLVIKTAPKLNNLNSDLVVRPSTITVPANAQSSSSTPAQPSRPSVLETNPYATVIKTENKRFNETPPSSPHHTLAAVERLPPDTSIMALPARNPYGVVRSAIQTNHNNNISSSQNTPSPTLSNYSRACEKNPNFLGRKRHLQEYSQQMSLNEPEAKHKRYMDTSNTPPPPSNTKPQIAMRPADISVIAVNEVKQEEKERPRTIIPNSMSLPKEEVHSSFNSNAPSVIASTTNNSFLNNTNNSKVIVNNVKPTNPNNTSSVLVVCKQEPLTPTGDINNTSLTTSCNKTPEMPPNSFTARIRTKAELKGFTFNPPPPAPIQTKEINNSPNTSPVPQVNIKQEEDEEEQQHKEEEEEEEEEKLIPAEKIKEELISKIELPSIPGLDEKFEEKNLFDFGWSNTCNNFMEQLLTRSAGKKKTLVAKTSKDSEMLVTSSETVTMSSSQKLEPLENQNFSTMESADNTTRSSFARLDAAGVDSSLTFNNQQQDSINSQSSQFAHKKLSKTEREKKRYQQEKRLKERLKAKDSSSESEDELDKRKTERLKKPLMKTKHKLKSNKTGNTSNSSDKIGFSDCGSDSSSTEMAEDKSDQVKKSPVKLEIKEEIVDEEEKEKLDEIIKNNNEKCDIKLEKEDKEHEKEEENEGNIKKVETKAIAKEEKQLSKKETDTKAKESELNKTKRKEKSAAETTENEEEDEEEDDEEEEDEEEDDEEEKEECSKQNSNQKGKLNTMTRSKRKQELEQQLANSKVLRNDKIIRNFSNANSSNKIKRKYNRKYNTVNSLLESGGLSRESGIMKSTRLKAKLERNGGKLNIIKNNKVKTNNNKLQNTNNKDLSNNKLKNSKPENVHDRNVIDLYRFKRALKVPPSLINIKHPGAHKIAASLPDLERHAEALEAYAKKREKNSMKNQSKFKTNKGMGQKIKTEAGAAASNQQQSVADNDEPKSIIDLLHSRVTKASGMNVRNKTTTTTAVYRPTKPCCTSSGNNSKTLLNNSSNNCGMFSETSQTTESSELQMLPELKKDSDLEEDNEDNDSTNGGKKRHFSIFDTKVLPTKTRTESKLQQKKENIREIFVGDDRPASAPPEMTQTLESSEKMTYEQKYEQFLQQMNIVVSADTLGRLGRSAAAKKLPSTATNGNQDLSNLNIKQEENDTESTSVIDGDDLKEDHKSIPNHFRKRRGKYLRRKGSSGFDYIRKKKKPTPASSSSHQHNSQNQHMHNGPLSNLHHYSIKSEKYDIDEYEHKIKTEDDVSREIQKWVLNKGVGQSTMHKAARQGYIDVIVYCLDRMGMNPDQKDNAGYTPLHEACTNGWLNIARVLLQYGANHSEAAHSGIRPLHEASENDHEEIVRLLLSYGADPLLATYSGQTPLMLASSKTMRDILSNHLVDVQSMGPERKPWRFNGPWEIYDPSECGYNIFEGAPNTVCDMSRALLRRGSLTNNQMYQNNKKLNNVLNTTITTNTAGGVATTATNNLAATIQNLTNNLNSTTTSTNSTTAAASYGQSAITNNAASTATNANSSSTTTNLQPGIETVQAKTKTAGGGDSNSKSVMEKCAVVLDNIDRFNSVRLYNDNKPEILVENSDSDGEMFEFEEADVLLPPLYLLKDEGTQDKWVLLNDLCNLLKVKSKDTLLNKIYPSTTSSSAASVASAHKSLMRELKMSDFLEKATCLQLLCAGEKLNICASKVVLIKYNENVRNLLGVKTILMKF